MKTILREQAELQSPRGQDSLSLDEPPPPTGGASSPTGGRKLKKVNSVEGFLRKLRFALRMRLNL